MADERHDDAGSPPQGPYDDRPWADEAGDVDELEVDALPTARLARIVGLLGVGSLPGMLFCGLGTPLAVVALAMAPSARRQVEAAGGRLGGLGIIRAARICSVISLLIAVVMVVGVVVAWTWFIDHVREDNSRSG